MISAPLGSGRGRSLLGLWGLLALDLHFAPVLDAAVQVTALLLQQEVGFCELRPAGGEDGTFLPQLLLPDVVADVGADGRQNLGLHLHSATMLEQKARGH